MQIRRATSDDAEGMARVLQSLAAAGLRRNRSDAPFALDHYISHPDRIACHVAVDGVILGFQSLKLARPGNAYGVTPGWGIIGTHIDPGAHRRGAGRALFAATRRAAIAAGLDRIDATIGAGNAIGQAYYAAMGFRTYRQPDGAVCKLCELRQRQSARPNS